MRACPCESVHQQHRAGTLRSRSPEQPSHFCSEATRCSKHRFWHTDARTDSRAMVCGQDLDQMAALAQLPSHDDVELLLETYAGRLTHNVHKVPRARAATVRA